MRLPASTALSLTLLITSCATPKALMAELAPRSLRANNLEETLSRRDEVILAYSLVSYDNHDKAVGVINGGWGVESLKKGQSASLGQIVPVRLPMPRGGKIVASVVLLEVDDNKTASNLVTQIQKVNNIVAVPAGILLTATGVLTPLKYVTAGLAAAGLGLQFANQLDDDDMLGQSSVTIAEADWRRSGKRFMHVPARFTGQHLRDSFDYELTYDLALKTLKMGPSGQ